MYFLKNICCQFMALSLFVILCMASCTDKNTGDRRAELIAMTPDNASIIAFDPIAILKSAGADVDGKRIEPMPTLSRFTDAGSFGAYFSAITSADGVNRSATVIGGDNNGYFWLIALDSPSAFVSWTKNNDYEITTIDEYTVCLKQVDSFPCAFVVDGSTAWFVPSAPTPDDAMKLVKKIKAAASESSIAQWKVERLAGSDINLLIDMKSYGEMMSAVLSTAGIELPQARDNAQPAYSVTDIAFDGPTIKINSECYDASGNHAPMFVAGTYSPISSSLLSFVKDYQLSLSFSLPDVVKNTIGAMLKNTYSLPECLAPGLMDVTQALKPLKSFSIGMSIDENASIADLKPTDMSAILSIEYDKGEADKTLPGLLDYIHNYDLGMTLANGMKAWRENSMYVVAPVTEFPDFKIYFSAKDNFAFVSTLAGMADLDMDASSGASDKIADFSLNLKKSHPVLAIFNCPFGVEINMTSTDEKSEGYVTLTDVEGGFLENIIKFITRL